jgi:hypothetical protein
VVTTLIMIDYCIDSYSSANLNLYLSPWAWPGTSRPLKLPIDSLATHLWPMAHELWPPGVTFSSFIPNWSMTWLYRPNLAHWGPNSVSFPSFSSHFDEKQSEFIGVTRVSQWTPEVSWAHHATISLIALHPRWKFENLLWNFKEKRFFQLAVHFFYKIWKTWNVYFRIF